MAWLLGQPAVGCVIAGVTSVEQVATNAQSAAWTLSAAERAAVAALAPRWDAGPVEITRS